MRLKPQNQRKKYPDTLIIARPMSNECGTRHHHSDSQLLCLLISPGPHTNYAEAPMRANLGKIYDVHGVQLHEANSIQLWYSEVARVIPRLANSLSHLTLICYGHLVALLGVLLFVRPRNISRTSTGFSLQFWAELSG